MAPVLTVIRVNDVEALLTAEAQCPYGLTASIFGDEASAQQIAKRLTVGTVIINDLIVPTADPRIPFGGRRGSGHGVTRGAEGLLEMTAVKVTSVRRGASRRHYEATDRRHEALFAGLLALSHGGSLREKFHGIRTMLRAIRTLGKGSGRRQTMKVGVVGSGLAGLAAACTLAARGYAVEVFEKNPWIGGKAATVARTGASVSTWARPSSSSHRYCVASLMRPGASLRTTFRWCALDPQWRCFFEDGMTLDLRDDKDAMAASLEAIWPKMGAGYLKFLEQSEQLHSISERFFFWRSIGSMRDTMDVKGRV